MERGPEAADGSGGIALVAVLLYTLTGGLEDGSDLLCECFALCHLFRVKNGPQHCVGFFSGAGSILKMPKDVSLVSVGIASESYAVKDSVIAVV